VWIDLGSLILATFLVVASLVFHAFWRVDDPQPVTLER
jgi:hypothetical protein